MHVFTRQIVRKMEFRAVICSARYWNAPSRELSEDIYLDTSLNTYKHLDS